jgi:alkylation response protein AidB-like acyl-CoA dehydrogenase
MARVDSSIATFFGVHSGLAMGSIYLGGSEEQKQKWLLVIANRKSGAATIAKLKSFDRIRGIFR